MANQSYPSIDGIAPSWADIAVTTTLTGGPLVDMADIDGIKCSRKLDIGEQRGASGGRVMKRTRGQGSQEASMSLYRSGYRTFLKALKDAAPQRGNQKLIGLVTFDIMIQHTPPGESEIYQRKLKGCRYLGDSDDMKEGSDADKIEVTLNPIEVVDIIDGEEVVLI